MDLSRRSLFREVQEFLSAPLGYTSQFYRLVTIPQIFVFVFLAVVGSVLGESLVLLLSKISGIFVIFSAHLVIESRRERFRFIDLLLEMMSILTVLEVFVVMLELDVSYAFFLPATLSLILFTMVRMSWVQRLIFSVTALCASAPGMVPATLARLDDSIQGVWFLFCFTELFGPFMFDLLRKREIVRTVREFRQGEKRSVSPPEPERGYENANLDSGLDEALVQLLNQAMRTRLTTIVVIVGAGTLSVAEVLGVNDLYSRLGFGAIFAAQCLLLGAMGRETRSPDLWRHGFAVVIGLLCWWCIFTVRVGGEPVEESLVSSPDPHIISPWGSQREVLEGPFADLVLIVIVIGVGSIGWPFRLSAGLACVVLLITFARLPTHRFPIGSILLGLVVACAVLLEAAQAYLSLVAAASWSVIRGALKRGYSPLDGWHLLANLVPTLGDVRRSVLILERGTSLVFELGGSRPSEVTEPTVRELLRRYRDAGPECRIVSTRELGHEFLGALADWFLHVPRAVVLLVGSAGEGAGSRCAVLFPVPPTLVFNPTRDRKNLLNELVREVSEWSLRQSDGDANDPLQTTMASAEREQELHRAVHAVNNVAQSVAIACERIRKRGSLDPGTSGDIEEIEMSVRRLSMNLSDQRLLRELGKMTSSARVERIRAASIVEDLEWSMRHLARPATLRVSNSAEELRGIGMEVVGRTYLGVVLRSIIRQRASRSERAHVSPEFSVETFADHVSLRLGEGGTGELRGSAREGLEDLDELAVRALSRFCALSEARYEFSVSGFDTWLLELTLRRWAVTPDRRVDGSVHWALLVDDNPEITSFYQHAAEALGLVSRCAASYEGAMALVVEEGAPALVVTDIHLGGASGLDLIRSLSGRFSSPVPIIVVSGESLERLAQDGIDLSVVRHLMKPVSRKRLFTEMRDVLWGGGRSVGTVCHVLDLGNLGSVVPGYRVHELEFFIACELRWALA